MNEAARREAQGKIAAKLAEINAAFEELKALADEHGLHFEFEAPSSRGGGFTYYGDKDGDGYYSLDGAWYSSNC